MRTHAIFAVTIAAAAISAFVLSAQPSGAAGSDRIALTGQVSSIEDGPMEGVLVSARQEGSTVTITVVSGEQGRYSFPSTKVAPGRYAVRIRAVGYDLDGPKAVEVGAAIRRGHRRSGEVSRQHQSQLGSDVVVFAQDASAPDRPVDARHLHGVRPSAENDRAARRRRRFGWDGVVLQFR